MPFSGRALLGLKHPIIALAGYQRQSQCFGAVSQRLLFIAEIMSILAKLEVFLHLLRTFEEQQSDN